MKAPDEILIPFTTAGNGIVRLQELLSEQKTHKHSNSYWI